MKIQSSKQSTSSGIKPSGPKHLKRQMIQEQTHKQIIMASSNLVFAIWNLSCRNARLEKSEHQGQMQASRKAQHGGQGEVHDSQQSPQPQT
mmetsp:Transcript_37764/g.52337  ORF Transcript_37764/g.52337 Transcript_37764/m.52337 type:complete len:91 (-) Transcript_37764:220-492(-)